MNNLKKYFPWTIRILIALLFILSAAAKLYPSPYFAISTFEVKQLYTLGFSESVAPFFSRILIGIEFALGFLLLSKHFFKKITIPATLLMLIVFTIHLTIITYFNGGSEGNCGCFGELIPMTPAEAIVKNVIAIGLLILLLWLIKRKPDAKSNFWILTTITLASILGVFMLTFSQPSTTENEFSVTNLSEKNNIEVDVDSIAKIPTKLEVVNELPLQIKASNTEKLTVDKPKLIVTKSGYAKYFSDIDSDTKILCFFVPGCPHCAKTANELTLMKSKDKNFPKVQILFMDEEADRIPEFFEIAGATYSYKIIDIIGFWKILGSNRDVPGVKILKNGKELKYFYGTTDNEFNATETLKIIKEAK